jgi:hypothetical protein
MFSGLRESIETLQIPPCGAAVTEVAQLYSALGARLTIALGEIDRSGEWELDGSASMTAWVRTHLGWTNQQANRVLKVARRLRTSPVTAEAWLAGGLSDGQVEVIAANVTERRSRLWAEHEGELVPLLTASDVTGTTSAMQAWAAKADAVLDEAEPPDEPPAEAVLARTLDGRGYLRGTFDAEATEVIATGLRLADSGDLDTPSALRQGQAMVDVFRFFLDHQQGKLGKRHRPHLNVVIEEPSLRAGGPGRTLGGVPLPGSTVRRIACDATVHRVITDGRSSILDYGRSTRTIPPAVYTSLVLRDWGCRFPGCDRPAAWTEGHHVWHWEDGGPTRLSNLVLLCSKHHHVVHQKGWQLRLDPTGTVEVTDPTGRRRTSDPPGIAAVA